MFVSLVCLSDCNIFFSQLIRQPDVIKILLLKKKEKKTKRVVLHSVMEHVLITFLKELVSLNMNIQEVQTYSLYHSYINVFCFVNFELLS